MRQNVGPLKILYLTVSSPLITWDCPFSDCNSVWWHPSLPVRCCCLLRRLLLSKTSFLPLAPLLPLLIIYRLPISTPFLTCVDRSEMEQISHHRIWELGARFSDTPAALVHLSNSLSSGKKNSNMDGGLVLPQPSVAMHDSEFNSEFAHLFGCLSLTVAPVPRLFHFEPCNISSLLLSARCPAPAIGDSNTTLWQFLLELLRDGGYPHLIQWTNREGEFKVSLLLSTFRLMYFVFVTIFGVGMAENFSPLQSREIYEFGCSFSQEINYCSWVQRERENLTGRWYLS